MENNWQKYYLLTKNSQPSKLLAKAISFVAERDLALDLGAGGLGDSRFLIDEGFKKVIAVDREEIPFEIVNEFSKNNFKLIHCSFEQFNFSKHKYDLINARYSLPFNNPGSFDTVWRRIYASLNRNGIFIGQFFGIRDEWYLAKINMTFHTREKIVKLLVGLEILEMVEEEKEGFLANGKPKHWHTFHVIARRTK